MKIGFIGLGTMGAQEAKRRHGGREGELHVVKLLEEKTHTAVRAPGDWPAPWERTRKPS